MKLRIIITFSFISLYVLLPVNIHSESSEIVYTFRNFRSSIPEKMILVGEIKSKTKMAATPGSSPYKEYDARMDQVTVKVLDRRGIKIGQKLYVVDKNPHHGLYRNALVNGKIIVKSLFHSPFYGWVLTGNGILLRVREGNFVVRTLESENLEHAFALKKKGDQHASRGETEKAISSYTAAVEADKGLPEAHAALGFIYFNMSDTGRAFPVKALAEYQEAYRYKENFRYDYDRFEFCNNYMEALAVSYSIKKTEASPNSKNVVQMLDRIIELGNIASEINANHPDILFHVFRANVYKMNYYSKRSSPPERNMYESSQISAGKNILPLLRGPVSSAEVNRVAILFLNAMKKDMKTSEIARISEITGELYSSPIYVLNRATRQTAASSDPEQKIREMIQYHLELYYRYLDRSRDKADPYIEELKGNYSL